MPKSAPVSRKQKKPPLNLRKIKSAPTARKTKSKKQNLGLCFNYKQVLVDYLSLPASKEKKNFSKKSEELIEKTCEKLNSILKTLDHPIKINEKHIKDVIRELYKSPTPLMGGMLSVRPIGLRATVRSRPKTITYTQESKLMDKEMVSAILGLIAAVILAYFIYIRFTQLNGEINITGQITEQTRVILDSIRYTEEPDKQLTFLSFWLRYFQNIHTNIVKDDIELLRGFLFKVFDQSAADLAENLQSNCNVNPTAMVDWVSSYMAPESLTACITATTSAHSARYMAEQAMLMGKITKLSTDIYKMCFYANNLAIGSTLYIGYRVKAYVYPQRITATIIPQAMGSYPLRRIQN